MSEAAIEEELATRWYSLPGEVCSVWVPVTFFFYILGYVLTSGILRSTQVCKAYFKHSEIIQNKNNLNSQGWGNITMTSFLSMFWWIRHSFWFLQRNLESKISKLVTWVHYVLTGQASIWPFADVKAGLVVSSATEGWCQGWIHGYFCSRGVFIAVLVQVLVCTGISWRHFLLWY